MDHFELMSLFFGCNMMSSTILAKKVPSKGDRHPLYNLYNHLQILRNLNFTSAWLRFDNLQRLGSIPSS